MDSYAAVVIDQEKTPEQSATTSLKRPQEHEIHDLLREVRARMTRKTEQYRAQPGGPSKSDNLGWCQLQILKHKVTGIVWMVVRKEPELDVILDSPLPGRPKYEWKSSSNGGMVSFAFSGGNLAPGPAGLMEKWDIFVITTSIAKEMATWLNE